MQMYGSHAIDGVDRDEAHWIQSWSGRTPCTALTWKLPTRLYTKMT